MVGEDKVDNKFKIKIFSNQFYLCDEFIQN